MPVLLEQILEMPHAAILAEQVKNALAGEKQKRARFYEIVEENKKMEFINGEIVFQSPVKIEHNSATTRLCKLISTFVDKHDLGFIGVEKILISLTRNDYEPDIVFFDKTTAANFKPGQMQFPAPSWVIEVLSPSTEKHDRETKFQDYAAHGVQEYWIVDPEKEIIEQYFLQNERYELVFKSGNGEIQSLVLTNFQIPVRAVFDKQINLQILGELLSE